MEKVLLKNLKLFLLDILHRLYGIKRIKWSIVSLLFLGTILLGYGICQ